MHPHPSWLAWIEKRLSPEARRSAEAHLADCPACQAELAETRDLVDALGTLPVALQTLPWRQKQLWPAIRAGRARRANIYPAWSWATGVSLVLLLGLFSGVWGGGNLNPPPTAVGRVAYVVQPPVPAPLPSTPRMEAPPQTVAAGLAHPGGTPLASTPLPAPAQTPSFMGK